MSLQKDFSSDNRAGASPEILRELADANKGPAAAYGEDASGRDVERVVSNLFEKDVAVFPVVSGTAANCLALAAVVPAYGGILCSDDAHISRAECGAPEFFTAGAKIITAPSDEGRLTPEQVTATLDAFPRAASDRTLMAALSVTQSTECGTLYSCSDIQALSTLAHQRGLAMHMDGARFANALVSLGCSPAELSWKAGVDMLSLGTSKNGTYCGELIIFFDVSKRTHFRRILKRSGHLLAKQRFLSAQILAYFRDDLWLRNARQANRTASLLARKLAARPDIVLRYEAACNEVFAILPDGLIEALRDEGYSFKTWGAGGAGRSLVRFVTSFCTQESDIEALANCRAFQG
ncbi:MAG: beta-eliminating lyase-related protein [Gluconacetobacter sp.]|uniref:Low specificity L-threonine aldolase n=1 Tax=Gluconacetobacter dulcium TaxID=2729096 RepID=A0A7W4JXQ5_9PROT|nr:beta-eliminating lyase-related protein [Gluconacetobacter dulcium]MBB2196668.1 low specificity L-threonine aldolase [Gluconacetobacter dulcium]